MKLNLKPGFFIPQSLKYFDETPDTLSVPIGYGGILFNNIKVTSYKDFRVSRKYNNIISNVKLREYQENVTVALKDKTVGVVSAPTGSGKTVMMAALIAQKKQKTLVLVNTKELANQFKESLLRFTNLTDENVSVISTTKKELKPITICLLQQYYRLPEETQKEFSEYFGMVLTDEVHIVGADTYFSVLDSIPAKYKFGFTATPKRGDGMDMCIFLASGPLVHSISIDEIDTHVLKPELEVIQTEYHFPLFDVSEYTEMITDLSSDEDRNALIAKTVQESKYNKKQKVLLCSRVMQCVHLQQLIPRSKILVGSISKVDQDNIKILYPNEADKILKQKGIKHRRNVVKELNDGTLRTVISTFSLFSTGLDFSNLEMAAFCAPLKSEILVKQCRGRIMRTGKKGKAPICLEFEDYKVGLLKAQSKTRQRILRKFE